MSGVVDRHSKYPIEFPRKTTVQQQILEWLRELILSGYMVPGEKINEAEIAERIGLSRIPLREALRTLEAEGLVKSHPYRGAKVAELSPMDIAEIYDIRVVLEGMVIRRAASGLNKSRLDRIREIKQQMERAVEDPQRWLELNEAFHEACYEAGGGAHFLGVIRRFRRMLRPYILIYISSARRLEQASEGHEEILGALERGDGVAAEEAVRRHLEEVRDTLAAKLSCEL